MIRIPSPLVAMYALLAAVGCLQPAIAEGAGAATDQHRPNVLFIMVDDLRPELGAYGAEGMHTPNVDRLASEGLVFDHAYAQWPSCAPSRASILSGMRPRPRGSAEPRSGLPSLPRLFKDNGYRTVSIGKVYNDLDDDPEAWTEAPWRTASAADNWQGYAAEESHTLREQLWQDARQSNPDAQLYQFNAMATERADLPDAAYRDGQIAVRAVEALRDSAGSPFFIAVGFVKPHLPFAAPEQYWRLYDRNALNVPGNSERPTGSTGIPYSFRELQSYQGIPEEMQLSEEQALELIHGYLACVSFIDAQIGRLLDELDRQGLRDDTIVVVVGDHGFHLGEQGVWGKHSLFETALHSPLIVSVPGQASAGSSTDALVELLDIFPSLSELAGLEAPSELPGASFAPLLDDPTLEWKGTAQSRYQHFREPFREIMGYSLRTERYRYTEWRGPESVHGRELYDLSATGTENTNLASDPDYAATVDELSRRLSVEDRPRR